VRDAPISRLDLLVSRNTLMYFTVEIARRSGSRVSGPTTTSSSRPRLPAPFEARRGAASRRGGGSADRSAATAARWWLSVVRVSSMSARLRAHACWAASHSLWGECS
jgi:hypothetical protein